MEGGHCTSPIEPPQIQKKKKTNVELDAKKAEVLHALKAGKLYLKEEYKVGGYMKLCQICNIAGNMAVSCYSSTHQQQ